MLTQQDNADIQDQVDNKIIPDIKKAIPGIIGFLLRTIFPKLNEKIVEAIREVVIIILNRKRK